MVITLASVCELPPTSCLVPLLILYQLSDINIKFGMASDCGTLAL